MCHNQTLSWKCVQTEDQANSQFSRVAQIWLLDHLHLIHANSPCASCVCVCVCVAAADYFQNTPETVILSVIPSVLRTFIKQIHEASRYMQIFHSGWNVISLCGCILPPLVNLHLITFVHWCNQSHHYNLFCILSEHTINCIKKWHEYTLDLINLHLI